MTPFAIPTRTHCLSPMEIETRLKAAGVSATAQRIAICRYVLCEADHPTAEEVKAWADQNFPKMSLATVYNTLHTLVAAGLLKELKFPHVDKAIYDNNLTPHHHFLDEETGRLTDLAPEAVGLSKEIHDEFRVHGVEVLLRGRKKT